MTDTGFLLTTKQITEAHEGEKCRDCGLSIAEAQVLHMTQWMQECCEHRPNGHRWNCLKCRRALVSKASELTKPATKRVAKRL